MSTTPCCPECGLHVPPDAPLGLCPRCLMNASSSETTIRNPPRAGSHAAVVGWSEELAALRDLKLMTDEELERHASLASEDPSRLARVLVQAKKLTAYQAGAILQGKARGLLIGDYLVADKLGVGGMGVVFKANHRASGQVVALKILPPSFGRDPDALRRFRREFQVAARLHHPNLVPALEANLDRGVHYLTMEYIPGCDLDTLVERGGAMDLKLALHCVIQAARGLEAAHKQGVIHRDVKPGNIMIDPAGTVRVLDLGLARVIEQSGQLGRTVSGKLTESGAYLGTVDFLAPEQADDARSVDGRADIYSLGCTLFFLLTGAPPFEGDSVLKRLLAHQDRPAPSLRAARPEVPQAVEAIYQKMMSKSPSDRPGTMSDVILALEACRASAREAGDASADLKDFAGRIMKKASPRGRRDRDTTVFARETLRVPSFDPDLRLEDLMTDYRPEGGHKELTEEQLPPIVSRPLPKRVRRRRRSSPPYLLIALALFGIAPACYTLWLKTGPTPVATRPVVTASTTRPPKSVVPPPADPFQPGTVWLAPENNTRLTVLERQGESFRARLDAGANVHNIKGTIRKDRINWFAKDTKAIQGKQGFDNEGIIHGREIAISSFAPSTRRLVENYTLVPSEPAQHVSARTPEVFRPLFNGTDLDGWAGDVDGFEVRDGLLRAKTPEPLTIYTRDQYSDFVVRVEYRFTPRGNGGLAIRYPGTGLASEIAMCEIQILDEPSFPNIDPRQATGSAYGMVAAARGHLRPTGEWNTQVVTVRGSTIRVELNGAVILDTDLSQVHEFMNVQRHPGKDRTTGYLGLVSQDAPVDYRRIEIADLTRAAQGPD